jgi:hypothetical protein
MRSIPTLAAALLVLVVTGCSQPAPEVAAAPVSEGSTTEIPHGDHRPHHEGVVYMHGDLHFEVVLDRRGQHRVYFSDAMREDLPASAASSVTITVNRPGWSPEQLPARIDDEGEAWVADGAPVDSEDATARIAFDNHGEPYWIDVPFVPELR